MVIVQVALTYLYQIFLLQHGLTYHARDLVVLLFSRVLSEEARVGRLLPTLAH